MGSYHNTSTSDFLTTADVGQFGVLRRTAITTKLGVAQIICPMSDLG